MRGSEGAGGLDSAAARFVAPGRSLACISVTRCFSYHSSSSVNADFEIEPPGGLSLDEPPAVSVLIVDDRPENLLALEALLDPLGVHTVRAASGPEALRWAREEEFAVVLLDVMMPGMDGITFLKIAQSAQRALSAAVIVVTALSSQDAIARTHGLAVAEVVPKSIAVFDQVMKLVKRHLPMNA